WGGPLRFPVGTPVVSAGRIISSRWGASSYVPGDNLTPVWGDASFRPTGVGPRVARSSGRGAAAEGMSTRGRREAEWAAADAGTAARAPTGNGQSIDDPTSSPTGE